jgi:hypothetical protein
VAAACALAVAAATAAAGTPAQAAVAVDRTARASAPAAVAHDSAAIAHSAAGAHAPAAATGVDPGPGGLPPGTAPPHHPHPGPGHPGPPPHDAPPAGAPADDDPRPVAPRPTAGAPGSAPDAAALAVRDLRARATVPLAAARAGGLTASFVRRPGSLVAEVRLYARAGARGRRLVVSWIVPARGGRRVTVRVRFSAPRRGIYEIVVRAGAGRATLGPAVSARVRVD